MERGSSSSVKLALAQAAACPAIRAHPESPERTESPESQAHLDSLVSQVVRRQFARSSRHHRANLAHQDPLVHPVHKDPQANLAHLAPLVFQARMVVLVNPARPDLPELQVNLAQTAHPAMLASQARTLHQFPVILDPLVSPVPQDLLDRQVHQVPMVKQVNQARRDHQVHLVHLERMETPARTDHRVLPDLRAKRAFVQNTARWTAAFSSKMAHDASHYTPSLSLLQSSSGFSLITYFFSFSSSKGRSVSRALSQIHL